MQRIRASITYPLSGSAGVITLYTRHSLTEDGTTALLCSHRLRDALTAGKSMFSNTTVFVADAFVDTIEPATGTITDSNPTDAWTVTGDQGPGYLPPASQMAVTWLTADVVGGRRVRGRTFFGPLAVQDVDTDGTPNNTKLGHLDAAAAAWIDAGLTAVDTVVWHRPVGGAGGSDHVITAFSRKDKFAVLRSRRD